MKLSKTKTKSFLLKVLDTSADKNLTWRESVADEIIDWLDGQDCFRAPVTVESVVYYTDREFRRRYGQDSIFCDLPVLTTTIMKLAAFQGRNAIKTEDYKKFAYWLVHSPTIRKELGRQIQIWDLCRQQLWDRYCKTIDVEETITERKRISKKRILTFQQEQK